MTAEAIGQNVKMLMPAPFREQHDAYLSNYLHTAKKDHRHRLSGHGAEKDGSTFPMELSVCVTTVRAGACSVGFVRDLTESKAIIAASRNFSPGLFHASRLTEMGQVASSVRP